MGRFVGIDIGSRVINVALLDVGYRRLELKALAEVPVDAAATLEEAIRAAAIPLLDHVEAVGTAVDGDLTFTHRLSLPHTALKQIDEILRFELESALPIDLDELVFGYRVLRRKTAKDPVVVLTGATRTEHARARIELVKTAILREPDRVGHGALALANLVSVTPELRSPEPVALVDLGGRRTEVTILVGGEAVLVRTLSRGVSSLPEGAPVLAAEIRQTLLSFVVEGGADVRAVHLVGGGAAAAGAEAYFAYELGVPVTALPPMALGGVTPEDAQRLPRFAKAIALALGAAGRGHDIDFRTGPLSYQRGFSFLKEKAPLLIGLGSAVIISFLFSVWAELRALSKEHETAQVELERVTQEAFEKGTTDPDEALTFLELAKNPAESDPMPKLDAFDVMVEISKAIPTTITSDIEELDMQRGHVRIQGIVNTTADASTVRDKVAEGPCVTDAKIGKVTQVVNGTKQKYVLEYDVKCPGEPGAKKKTTEKGEGDAKSGDATGEEAKP
jgi:general secretion pathway protein L